MGVYSELMVCILQKGCHAITTEGRTDNAANPIKPRNPKIRTPRVFGVCEWALVGRGLLGLSFFAVRSF